ncbi:hypothetical protein MMC16_007588, partial [Acarospora aff. strigata]|nr:hypothetical protein [Acarospora aff. strigata]
MSDRIASEDNLKIKKHHKNLAESEHNDIDDTEESYEELEHNDNNDEIKESHEDLMKSEHNSVDNV